MQNHGAADMVWRLTVVLTVASAALVSLNIDAQLGH